MRAQSLLICLACLAWSQLATAVTDILIVQSHDSTPYQQMLSGFQAGLYSRGLNMNYSVQNLGNNGVEQILQDLQPRLVFTLGTPACRAVLSKEHKIPIVTGLMLDQQQPQQNVTGVSLAFPATTHWLWLKRLLPDARHIAVIHDPSAGEQLFQTLQQRARTENIELIGVPIQAPEDLPAILQQLPPQLDGLWALNGASAFNAVTVRELLLYSFRNRTPLIGLSEQWVKAGAMYALDWDYVDLGNQAAELAWTILANGSVPGGLPDQAPRKVRPVFNSKTVEHMKLSVPERWLPEMTEVVQ